MAKTKVLVVRHGESEWNKQKKYQGMSDIALTERGVTQAGYAREALKDVQIDVAFCSPLIRAQKTAQVIMSEHEADPQVIYDFHEQDLGDWEGLVVDEIMERYPEEFSKWLEEPRAVHVPGGELIVDVQKRMVKAFKEVVEANQGKTILIVAHMVCISSLLFAIEDVDMNELWMHPLNNCSITTIEVEENGEAHVTDWNGNSHLPEEDRKLIPDSAKRRQQGGQKMSI